VQGVQERLGGLRIIAAHGTIFNIVPAICAETGEHGGLLSFLKTGQLCLELCRKIDNIIVAG
jgi:hypothetical protein